MKKTVSIVLILALGALLVACGGGSASSSSQAADATATASVYTNQYTNLDQAQLLEAMTQYKGVCTVATVNADGSPNLAVFVPGVVGENHIMFGWADNATKANFLRDGRAVMTYDVVDLAAETKEGRHQGAVLHIVPEEDTAVLDELKAALPEEVQGRLEYAVICRIEEVLPIG